MESLKPPFVRQGQPAWVWGGGCCPPTRWWAPNRCSASWKDPSQPSSGGTDLRRSFQRENGLCNHLSYPVISSKYCIPFHATHNFQFCSVSTCSSPILPSDLHLWLRNEVFFQDWLLLLISWAYLLPQWTAWNESLTWLVLSEKWDAREDKYVFLFG